MSNFKTKCKNYNISTSIAPLGSRWVSKEAKNFKELEFVGLGRCFSVRIEESSKTSKIQPKTAILGWFFEVSSIWAEKQRPKPKNSSSLKIFASFDTSPAPRGEKVKQISQFLHFLWNLTTVAPSTFFSLFFKIRPRVSFIDLKIIKGVFLALS